MSVRFAIHQFRLWLLQCEQSRALADAKFHAEAHRDAEIRHSDALLREVKERQAFEQYMRVMRGVR